MSEQIKIVNLFILDTSGSMSSIKGKIINGFNEQVQEIKKLDAKMGTKSSFGLIVFDTEVGIRYLNQPIETAELLTNSSYKPDGGTAFYDAVCEGIKALEDSLGSSLTESKVLVTLLTDGEDNSSKKFLASQAGDLIKQYQQDYGWTFSCIGANIDLDKLSQVLNIPKSNTLNFVATQVGTQHATDSLNSAR